MQATKAYLTTSVSNEFGVWGKSGIHLEEVFEHHDRSQHYKLYKMTI